MTSQQQLKSGKRVYNHMHNGMLGTVGIIFRYLIRLRDSPSLTPNAREALTRLESNLEVIKFEISNYRVEPDGTITTMRHRKGGSDV